MNIGKPDKTTIAKNSEDTAFPPVVCHTGTSSCAEYKVQTDLLVAAYNYGYSLLLYIRSCSVFALQ